jgi:Flp pilus assembly pilin Flp
MPISRNALHRSADELSTRLNQPPGVAEAAPGAFASERGSVTVEYAVLLGVVSIGCMFAIVGLGVPLVRMYQANQIWLLLPIP